MTTKTEHTDMNLVYGQLMDTFKAIGQRYPEYIKGFMTFSGQGTGPGELSQKSKELIAVALSITQHCKFCISFHVKAALEQGATPGEILESAMVAGVQGGGPAIAHIKYVLDAIEVFSD